MRDVRFVPKADIAGITRATHLRRLTVAKLRGQGATLHRCEYPPMSIFAPSARGAPCVLAASLTRSRSISVGDLTAFLRCRRFKKVAIPPASAWCVASPSVRCECDKSAVRIASAQEQFRPQLGKFPRRIASSSRSLFWFAVELTATQFWWVTAPFGSLHDGEDHKNFGL